MSNLQKILIVGSGITGVLSAKLLKNKYPNVLIEIWDKAKHFGGRFCTDYRQSSVLSMADLGAQYISITPKNSKEHNKYYAELREKLLLRPLTGTTEGMMKSEEGISHYICPEGFQSLIQYFLNESGLEVICDREVKSILLNRRERKWMVSTTSNHVSSFDGLIFTIPVPELLKIKGSFYDILETKDDIKSNLEEVKYSTRYAAAVYFDENCNYFKDISWIFKYLDDDIIRYMALDNKKRGREDEFPSLVIHSTKEFGQKFFNSELGEVTNILLSRLKQLLPDLPTPSYMKCKQWIYSQVEKSYENNSCGSVVLNEFPFLVCGGDSFTCSTFDGCINSAESIINSIT